VSDSLPIILVVLPLVSAMGLAFVGSWRIGIWINAGSTTLLFLLACGLPWHLQANSSLLRAGAAETHMVLLTSFVAMTTSWSGMSDVRAALEGRLLDRRRLRWYHVACQGLIGAIMLALLSDIPALTWLAFAFAIGAAAAVTRVVRAEAASEAASRLILLCGAGLLLALLGTLLLHLAAQPHAAASYWSTLRAHGPAADLACLFLLLGYGTVAGLIPLHLWLVDAAAEGTAPGAIIVCTLMVNAPLLVLLRLRAAVPTGSGLPWAVLMIIGLASLWLSAIMLWSRLDMRRTVAIAGIGQIGMVAFAFGIAGPAVLLAGSLHMTLLTLARASVLQCQSLAPTQATAWTCTMGVLTLALLPLLALFLIAGISVDHSAWLLLPLGAGVLLTSWALVALLPSLAPASGVRAGNLSDLGGLAPIWLQLGLILLFALAMPAPMVDWLKAVAAAR
jgi:hydrogenase-4 component F